MSRRHVFFLAPHFFGLTESPRNQSQSFICLFLSSLGVRLKASTVVSSLVFALVLKLLSQKSEWFSQWWRRTGSPGATLRLSLKRTEVLVSAVANSGGPGARDPPGGSTPLAALGLSVAPPVDPTGSIWVQRPPHDKLVDTLGTAGCLGCRCSPVAQYICPKRPVTKATDVSAEWFFICSFWKRIFAESHVSPAADGTRPVTSTRHAEKFGEKRPGDS